LTRFTERRTRERRTWFGKFMMPVEVLAVAVPFDAISAASLSLESERERAKSGERGASEANFRRRVWRPIPKAASKTLARNGTRFQTGSRTNPFRKEEQREYSSDETQVVMEKTLEEWAYLHGQKQSDYTDRAQAETRV
jgi:hypothetical protein